MLDIQGINGQWKAYKNGTVIGRMIMLCKVQKELG